MKSIGYLPAFSPEPDAVAELVTPVKPPTAPREKTGHPFLFLKRLPPRRPGAVCVDTNHAGTSRTIASAPFALEATDEVPNPCGAAGFRAPLRKNKTASFQLKNAEIANLAEHALGNDNLPDRNRSACHTSLDDWIDGAERLQWATPDLSYFVQERRANNMLIFGLQNVRAKGYAQNLEQIHGVLAACTNTQIGRIAESTKIAGLPPDFVQHHIKLRAMRDALVDLEDAVADGQLRFTNCRSFDTKDSSSAHWGELENETFNGLAVQIYSLAGGIQTFRDFLAQSAIDFSGRHNHMGIAQCLKEADALQNRAQKELAALCHLADTLAGQCSCLPLLASSIETIGATNVPEFYYFERLHQRSKVKSALKALAVHFENIELLTESMHTKVAFAETGNGMSDLERSKAACVEVLKKLSFYERDEPGCIEREWTQIFAETQTIIGEGLRMDFIADSSGFLRKLIEIKREKSLRRCLATKPAK